MVTKLKKCTSIINICLNIVADEFEIRQTEVYTKRYLCCTCYSQTGDCSKVAICGQLVKVAVHIPYVYL